VENPAPKRQFNLPQVSAIIVGTVIGSGVFISLPIVARIGGSPWMSVLIWVLGGVIWIPQVLVLAEMGTAYPAQGACYVYLNKAGSPFLAFLYTWTAFLTSDTPTLTIVALSAMSALRIFSPVFADPVMSKVLAGLLIVGLALIHFRSVRTGGNLQVFITLAKLIPLVSIVIFGVFFLDSGNLSNPPFFSGVEGSLIAVMTAGLSSTLWSYAGFTNILYVAGEVRSPERNLPIALVGSLAFVIAGYLLISICTSAIVPFAELIAIKGDFVNPFQYLPIFSTSAGAIFAVAAFLSMMGVLNAGILTQPRLEYAMARDGLFFGVFGHLHPRFLTPDYSILIQSTLGIVLFMLGNIENLLGYFTISYALQNMLLYGAIFFLRKRADYHPTYRAPIWMVMAGLAVLSQIYLAFGTFLAYPAEGALVCLGLILSGLPLYGYFLHRKRQQERARP
jgi:fructoselysine transporter